MRLREDEKIGGYRVMRALAKGGMGCVYEVEHEKLGVRYALKTFTLDNGCAVDLLRQRFLVEGKVLARLRHPNLVRVYDLDVDESTKTPYFVMDLILDKTHRSLTLDDIRPGKVDESTLVRWFGELASALDYIHEKGIVHRDIKTSNILVDEFGSVMLADFGISRYVGDDLRAQLGVESKVGAGGRPLESTMQIVLGTRAFMAPEVKAGRAATAASDAYSLGLVFFWMLTGVWPTGKIDQFDMLMGFEHDWWGVLPWLLNEAPHLRPSTLTEAARMLQACRQEPALRKEPDGARSTAETADGKPAIRDWMPLLRKSAAVGVALGVASGVYMATRDCHLILDAGVIGLVVVAVCAKPVDATSRRVRNKDVHLFSDATRTSRPRGAEVLQLLLLSALTKKGKSIGAVWRPQPRLCGACSTGAAVSRPRQVDLDRIPRHPKPMPRIFAIM